MSGGNDTSDPPVPPASDPGGEGDLVTSDDLFGDLVDGPLPPGERKGPGRPGPIRVQVSDPVSPGPFAALPDEPESPGEPGVPEHTPTRTHADDEVDDAFSRIGGLVAESIFRPAGPVVDDEEARLPPSVLKTGAKLSITHPKLPLGPGLDLASVAESAIEEKARDPEPEPPRPAPAASREPSWRDDQFGPYELIDRVAIGGMAEVFKAKRSRGRGLREDRGPEAHPAPPLRQQGVRRHVRGRGQDGGRPHPPEHRADLRPRADREELLHRDGVRARPRPAHDHEAGAGEGAADAPRPRACGW